MPDSEELLSFAEVAKLTGKPRSTIYDQMTRGTFPQRVNLLAGRSSDVAWRADEIREYLAGRWQQSTPARIEGAHFRLEPDCANAARAAAAIRRLNLYGYATAGRQPVGAGKRQAVFIPLAPGEDAGKAAADLRAFFPDLTFRYVPADDDTAARPEGRRL